MASTKRSSSTASAGAPRPPSARERILAAAAELFLAKGLNAVGIEAIIERAGVAKMSLYHHFESKDALIEAFITERDAAWREWFQKTVERLGKSPRARVMAIFDAAALWFATPEFRGCPFLNTAAELSDPSHPARKKGLEHKKLVKGYVEGLVREAGYKDPAEIADELCLLLNGAVSMACMEGSPAAAGRAKTAAKRLLEGATNGGRAAGAAHKTRKKA
jgi:AcrR family transcriptional regulator